MPQDRRQSQEQWGNPATNTSIGFPQPFSSIALLPLAIIGISGTLETRDAVHLQGVFAFAGPLVRRLDPGETTLEAGHDIAREQLIAVQCFFACGPVSYPDHEATKPATNLLQALDASDAVVRRADEPLIVLGHK